MVIRSILLMIVVAYPCYADIWYVDKSNTSGIEDGTSWTTAFRFIGLGNSAAEQAGGGEVWIAKGLYGENRGSTVGDMGMREGVEMYGGFTGNETSRDQRDWAANPTVIDGTESRDGEPAYRVVWANDNSRLDGFIIRGGVANGPPNQGLQNGGGIYVPSGASPVIANCVIEGNRAEEYGGGLYSEGATVQILNCTFVGNSAQYRGGAVYSATEGAEFVIRNSVFRGNESENGGALYLAGPDAQVVNSVFVGNSATERGGAILHGGAQPPLNSQLITFSDYINCTFYGNTASTTNHVFFSLQVVTLENCLFGGEAGDFYAVEDGFRASMEASHNMVPEGWLVLGAGDQESEATVFGDAAFVAPSLNNFRLRQESPAVDAGLATNAPDEDIEGTERPIGDGVDIGAYEFDPEVFVDPFDPSGDGMTDAVDIQTVINGALGAACATCDINGDGSADAVDVQLMINAALGMA